MSQSSLVQLSVDDRVFRFRIHKKTERLGDVTVCQLWMDVSKMYKSPMAKVLAECFWALCLQAQRQGEPEHRDDRQTYLLARLLPMSLSRLAAKVMPDRSLGPRSKKRFSLAAKEAAELTEELMRASEPDSNLPNLVDFRNQTYDLLGMPSLGPQAQKLYGSLCASLFDDAAELMNRDREAAAQLVRQRWASAKTQFYSRRRWKSPEAEQVMRVISYECRTALHECSSDTWTALLSLSGPLRSTYALTPADLLFLSLWNNVIKSDSDHPDARFDLFHGHIFSLHPAMRLLIRPERGKRLLGQLVSDLVPLSDAPDMTNPLARARTLPSFLRVLRAMTFAVYAYVAQREELASDRKNDRLRPMSQKGLEASVVRRLDLRVGGSGRSARNSDPLDLLPWSGDGD